jgi:hypothetical protein
VAGTDIVTLAEVKTHLNIPSSDTSQDAELAGFISAATPVIEHVVGPVVAREVVEKHDGGDEAIVLRQPPVLSITTVTEDGAAVASSGYTLSDAGVLYRTYGVWLCGRSKVQVTYQAGRTVVPPSIALAAKELIRINWRPQQGGNYSPFDGGAADQVGEVRLGFFVPNRVAEMLAPHAQGGFA